MHHLILQKYVIKIINKLLSVRNHEGKRTEVSYDTLTIHERINEIISKNMRVRVTNNVKAKHKNKSNNILCIA